MAADVAAAGRSPATRRAGAAGRGLRAWQVLGVVGLHAVGETRLILTCGLPGSGKTTLATRLENGQQILPVDGQQAPR